MIISAQGTGNTEAASGYTTVMYTLLSEGREQANVLGPYMIALFQQGLSEDGVLKNLAQVYDLESPKDLLIIARVAKDSGVIMFAKTVMNFARELMGS
jgi:hypothetical protein